MSGCYPFTGNPRCVIRKQNCGKLFSSSNIVFISCPGNESVAIELGIIKTVLEQNNLDPYVAVENYDPAKDIFCEKICAKIIQSKLCIVLLTNVTTQEGIISPNPNVYFEYGLMTSFAKTIIPLQKSDQKLAFNVHSLDTVKYSYEYLENSFSSIFQDTLARVVSDEDRSLTTSGPLTTLALFMELQGFALKPSHGLVAGTPFRRFSNYLNNCHKYGILIRNEGDLGFLRSNIALLLSRLSNLINIKKLKLSDLQGQAEVSNGPQNFQELGRVIRQIELELEAMEKQSEIVIVCADSTTMKQKIDRVTMKYMHRINISTYTLEEISNQVGWLASV